MRCFSTDDEGSGHFAGAVARGYAYYSGIFDEGVGKEDAFEFCRGYLPAVFIVGLVYVLIKERKQKGRE